MPLPAPQTPPPRPAASAVIPLPPPGLYLRACAVLARLFVPMRTRHSWQWYRRAFGGRWSLNYAGDRWHSVKACPGAMVADIIGGGPVPAGVCYDPTTGDAECHCEVWS